TFTALERLSCAIDSPQTPMIVLLCFFPHTSTTDIYTLSLHDALPIYTFVKIHATMPEALPKDGPGSEVLLTIRHSRRSTSEGNRSEEHTSELQSPYDLVCRLLLEKKKQAR